MDRREKFINQISNIMFYAGITIEVLLVLIDKSAFINPVEGQIFRITFLLFLAKVCFTKYSLKEYTAILLFGILGAVSYFFTGRNEVLRLIIMLAACKNVDMKKCMKLVFYMMLTGCAAIIFLSVFGICGDIALTQEYGRGGVETRYVLGMGHPNALHCMFWALVLLGLYLYAEKMKWFYFIFLFIINYFFFLLTGSKTSFLVTALTVLLAMILAIFKNQIFKKLCVLAGYLATVFSVGISVVVAAQAYRVYNYVWHGDTAKITMLFVRLNDIFNGRIRILVENDRFEGTTGTWSLFSRPENNYFFDMGWIRLFYWFGIIPGCVFVTVVFVLMIYCYKKQDYMAALVVISVSVYSVIEAHVFSDYLARNYVFFLLGMYWNQMFCLLSSEERYWWKIPELMKELK